MFESGYTEQEQIIRQRILNAFMVSEEVMRTQLEATEPMNPTWQVVATYPSKSDPSKTYEVRRHNALGDLSCECMPWKVSKQTLKACQHTRQYVLDKLSKVDQKVVNHDTNSVEKLSQEVLRLTDLLRGAEADRDSFEEMLTDAIAREDNANINLSMADGKNTVLVDKMVDHQLLVKALVKSVDILRSVVDKNARWSVAATQDAEVAMEDVALHVRNLEPMLKNPLA